MEPIPDDILKQFNAVLEQEAVPSSLRDDYRKWLRYYLDFRVKYPPPEKRVSSHLSPLVRNASPAGEL